MKNSEEKKSPETSIDIHGRIESLDQSLRSVDNRLRAVEKRLSIKTPVLEPDADMIIIEDLDKKDAQSEIEEIRKTVEALSKSLNEIKNEGVSKDLVIRVNNLQAEVSKLNNKMGIAGGGKISPEIESRVANAQAGLTKLQDKFREIDQKLVNIEKITNEAHVTSIKSIEAQLSDAEHRVTKLENLNKITIGKIKVPIELSGLVAALVLLGTGYLISTDQWSVIRSSYYPITIGILFGVVVIVKFIMTNRK